MDVKVGVDVKFPLKGPVRPIMIHSEKGARKISFFRCKNVIYHVIMEDGQQGLLQWDLGAGEWKLREID